LDQVRLRATLEEALDRMLEEEEEDLEFVRRELNPLGEDRLRAAARRRRERERAEEIVEEEQRLEAISRLTLDDLWEMVLDEEDR
jgi:hypothetical protein